MTTCALEVVLLGGVHPLPLREDPRVLSLNGLVSVQSSAMELGHWHGKGGCGYGCQNRDVAYPPLPRAPQIFFIAFLIFLLFIVIMLFIVQSYSQVEGDLGSVPSDGIQLIVE